RGPRRPGRTGRAGPPRARDRRRPRGALGGRPGPARQPCPQHALRWPGVDGAGAPHPLRPGGRGGRRGGDAMNAVLVLADGAEFEGEAIGAAAHDEPTPTTVGEVVFNTALSGYQEILTDPSYAGQVITFTCPHIGNYGVNAADDESRRPFCAGIVVRDL